MKQAPNISKAAFLARFNDRARRFAVDARFINDGGKCRLVIVYDNGEREPFRGFSRAA
jgi:hypothetical protein